MPEQHLTPAARDDLVNSLVYSLSFNRSGKAVRERERIAIRIAAEHIAEALYLAGFVILKKPPAPNHYVDHAPRER